MTKQGPLVSIKGTKDGIILALNDQCGYDQLLKELKEKLAGHSKHYQEGPMITVKVQCGVRHLTEFQQKEMTDIIRAHKKLYVESFESSVVTIEECEKRLKQQQMTTLIQIVRSGQILELEGDLLLIGDINPGAAVKVSGNLYIMGALKGSAYAGHHSGQEAFIAASVMAPTRLQIGEVVSDLIGEEPDESDRTQSMVCAYVNPSTQEMMIESIHSYFKKNKQLIKL